MDVKKCRGLALRHFSRKKLSTDILGMSEAKTPKCRKKQGVFIYFPLWFRLKIYPPKIESGKDGKMEER